MRSKDWAVGTVAFRKDLIKEHKDLESALERKDQSACEAREAHWSETLTGFLAAIGKSPKEIAEASKGSSWKVAVATAMKTATTAANPWLAKHLNMGSPFRLSRLVTECRTDPKPYQPYVARIAKGKV